MEATGAIFEESEVNVHCLIYFSVIVSTFPGNNSVCRLFTRRRQWQTEDAVAGLSFIACKAFSYCFRFGKSLNRQNGNEGVSSTLHACGQRKDVPSLSLRLLSFFFALIRLLLAFLDSIHGSTACRPGSPTNVNGSNAQLFVRFSLSISHSISAFAVDAI